MRQPQLPLSDVGSGAGALPAALLLLTLETGRAPDATVELAPPDGTPPVIVVAVVVTLPPLVPPLVGLELVPPALLTGPLLCATAPPVARVPPVFAVRPPVAWVPPVVNAPPTPDAPAAPELPPVPPTLLPEDVNFQWFNLKLPPLNFRYRSFTPVAPVTVQVAFAQI